MVLSERAVTEADKKVFGPKSSHTDENPGKRTSQDIWLMIMGSFVRGLEQVGKFPPLPRNLAC